MYVLFQRKIYLKEKIILLTTISLRNPFPLKKIMRWIVVAIMAISGDAMYISVAIMLTWAGTNP